MPKNHKPDCQCSACRGQRGERPKGEVLTITVPVAMLAQIRERAEAEGVSVAAVIRQTWKDGKKAP